MLDGSRDRQFLLVTAPGFFRLDQTSVLNKLRGFGRDRSQNVVADAGDIACGEARIDVECAHYFGIGGLLFLSRRLDLRLAQGHANDGAKIERDDALPLLHVEHLAGVGNQIFGVGSERLFQHRSRNRLVVEEGLAFGIPARCKRQVPLRIAKKNEAAFRACQAKGGAMVFNLRAASRNSVSFSRSLASGAI